MSTSASIAFFNTSGPSKVNTCYSNGFIEQGLGEYLSTARISNKLFSRPIYSASPNEGLEFDSKGKQPYEVEVSSLSELFKLLDGKEDYTYVYDGSRWLVDVEDEAIDLKFFARAARGFSQKPGITFEDILKSSYEDETLDEYPEDKAFIGKLRDKYVVSLKERNMTISEAKRLVSKYGYKLKSIR